MTDKELRRLIARAINAGKKFGELMREAEKEYENRFGFHPSDRDCDFWIDVVQYASASGGSNIKSGIISKKLFDALVDEAERAKNKEVR